MSNNDIKKLLEDDVEGLFEEEYLILSGKANIAVNYVWGWSKAIRPDWKSGCMKIFRASSSPFIELKEYVSGRKTRACLFSRPLFSGADYFFGFAGFFVFLGAHLEGFLVFLGAHDPQPIVHPPFIIKVTVHGCRFSVNG
ncbi:MAG TPA: hypothetical protein ENH01_07190 [Nitrospirae bacterium]|nr:hypothetical protein [Nitrospirota bacterium]